MSAEVWAHLHGIDDRDFELYALILDAYEAGQEDGRDEAEAVEQMGDLE